MRCLIIDDDKISRTEIEHYVKKSTLLKLTGMCTDATAAFNIIKTKAVDLLILDVMMPGMSGLELMKCLGDRKPQVILMTNEKKYALDAFNYDVTDFLVKPVSEDRFLRAVAKAKRIYDYEHEENEHEDYLFVRKAAALINVNTSDILYIEALGNFVNIHTENENLVIYGSLKSMIDKLSEKYFARVHQSYIVRLDKIKKIEFDNLIVDKNIIPVGRTYRKQLFKLLQPN